MKPTRRMFQVLLIRDQHRLPSRWFRSEQQAQFYCSEYNRIIEQEQQDASRAIYQPVEVAGSGGRWRAN